MSQFNPSVEKEVIWEFTVKEIETRWELHRKFDPLQRLFGDKKDNKPDPQETQRNLDWLKRVKPGGIA